MRISKRGLTEITPGLPIQIPTPESFELPEKILQFGTGVLLRGLPDHFVDQANKQGIFGGRIVMVKSTSRGDTAAFDAQDCVYTLCVRGLENGDKVENYYLNNAVSRVLTAQTEWDQILALAASPSMEIVLSNTTEVGIQLSDDDIAARPPRSFPGKLLAFLYARFLAFNGDTSSGMVIIPTELLTNNGDKLKKVLFELARQNKLSGDFLDWLDHCNTFCNSLVDRIVPGKLPAPEQKIIEEKLGYTDELMISAEPYSLWAIEASDEKTEKVLSFAAAAPGIVLSGDISKHRELKLRLLNGTHTFSCALAFLSGFSTVGEAMENESFSGFVKDLMTREITPAVTGADITEQEALAFAARLRDRFRNPFIVHEWLSISMQYTFKMRMRNIPLILAHYRKRSAPPEAMARGFAAYLFFMRSERDADGNFHGSFGDKHYLIQDEFAESLYEAWSTHPDNPAPTLLADESLWGTDLTILPGFLDMVGNNLHKWIEQAATV
jgi:tagaturonate reductase